MEPSTAAASWANFESPYGALVRSGASSVNATICENNSASYWQCDASKCDPGYHQTGFKCDPSKCGLVTCTTGWVNMGQCEANTDDFWQCSAKDCPAGYSSAGLACNADSLCGACNKFATGANVRHCVKI